MPYCALEDADQLKVEKKAADGIASLFTGRPLPSRTRPGPPLDPDADWAAFVRLLRPLLREAPEAGREAAARLLSRLECEPATLEAAAAIAWAGDLLAAHRPLDQRLSPKKPVWDLSIARAVWHHFAGWLVARAGGPALVACLDTLAPRRTVLRLPRSLWQIPNAVGVRSALVRLADADYDAAVAACLRLAEQAVERSRPDHLAYDREVAAYLAYVLADDRPGANHALRAEVQLPLYAAAKDEHMMDWRLAPFLVDVPPSWAAEFLPQRRELFFALGEVTGADAAATVLAVCAQAGEPATPMLAWILHRTQGVDTTNVAKALLATRAEDVLPALLPFLGLKLVRDAFDAADAADPAIMLRAYLAAAAGKGAALYGPRAAALGARHGAEMTRDWAKEGGQTVIGRLERLVGAGDASFAPREAWPFVLRDPPWRRKARPLERPVLAVAPIDTDPVHFRLASGRLPRSLIELPGFTGMAPAAAHALLRVKHARPDAAEWLRAYPRTATMRLLPDSLGPAGRARDAADAALHFIAATPEGRADLDATIAAYAAVDPRVPGAVVAGVDADPLEQAPRKPPKLPGWIVPSALARPRLASGEALPDEAVVAFCEMLLFSSPLAPYAGVAQVRAACLPDSLDAFAMDLFRAWLGAGGKAASEWAMWASAQIGGAACARDLARQIRVWASERAKPKALNGLEVLAAMGSDVALMNLDAIAEKSPFAVLREQARELIQRLAAARGLSLDELADRLTPDLGLDERGGLDLSFGARAFRVGFDEMLRPWVRDTAGQRLVTLPRPGKADDAALAKAATRRWSGLKANAEAVAGLQVSRLETMMSSQRRVTPDVFWRFFASHPLMRHLAARLVWGGFEGPMPRDGLVCTFRIEEDMSLTDADDEVSVLDLDAAILIGPVHPLHLGADALARWATLFSDYEIVQPFPQLARETFALADDEAAGARVMRFDGKRVAGSRLRGLRPQGWATEGDSETIRAVRRGISVPEGGQLAAVLAFDDGLARHPAAGDGVQVLRDLTLQDAGRAGPSATRRFGDLDAVTASEVLRAPSLLAAAGA